MMTGSGNGVSPNLVVSMYPPTMMKDFLESELPNLPPQRMQRAFRISPENRKGMGTPGSKAWLFII